ncbi:pre-RNA processing PIH1/Nop17-domain-containing protein [Cytidiella melzeri]|nr:pre-RNA processing PIH1/Nop17-domain-containing protein [Cytidiella melzeri]
MDVLNSTIRATLSPLAGFCIKSSALQPAVCKVTGESTAALSAQTSSAILPLNNTIAVARGQKVFINIAWDANVPPPPDASNDEIQKAMNGGQDFDDDVLASGGAWFVPVIVSEPRTDVDKAGKPSIVFDCVYNSSLKSRCLREPNFRAFLTELGLQRIEAQHSVALSRHLGTPNIASKGKLFPRTALVPLRLYPEAHPLREQVTKQKASLIQEIEPQAPPATIHEKSTESKPKGILKNLTQDPRSQTPESDDVKPRFAWAKEGDRIAIKVHAPNVTRVQVQNATLDVEPRRVILHVPPHYTLDIDLSLSDAQIAATFGGTSSSEDSVLMLKRQREFDVEGAKAEWSIQQGRLTVFV